jgi:hypothetical protein
MGFPLFGQEIDVLAAWGAVTGTFALLLLWRQHWNDRANLVLDAELKLTAEKDPSEQKLVFSLSAVNLGRRPIVLEEAGIKVPNLESQDPKLRDQASELRLQLPPKGLTLTEGQKQRIVMNPFTFALKEKKAVAFVRDTKGKEHIAEFAVPRPEAPKGENKMVLPQKSEPAGKTQLASKTQKLSPQGSEPKASEPKTSAPQGAEEKSKDGKESEE